jgi:nitroreductase
MHIKEAIRGRRAVKSFDPAHKMSAAEQIELFDLAQQSPSSFNIQHWRFVNVTDTATRKAIQDAAWGQAQVTEASLLLVLCADIAAWSKQPERYFASAPQPVRDALVPMIKPFYEGREQVQRDEAMRSVGLVAQTLMLAAKGMGYDTCPMIGFDAGKVGEIIKLPADHAIGMLIVVGKATKPAHPKGGYLPLSTIVVENHF